MRFLSFALLALLLPLAACAPHTPAPHPAPPRAVDLGGPVIASPRIQPVFFANEDPDVKAQIVDFTSRVGATRYWEATTHEYGVGPATAAAPIDLAEAPKGTVTYDQLTTWIADQLTGPHPTLPTPDEDTVVAIFYPAGVTLALGGAVSCQSFGGFHTVTSVPIGKGTLDVPVVVIPRCETFSTLTGLDAVTAAASHELIEAVTDPAETWSPAWDAVDDDHRYWPLAVGGAEIGDLCMIDPHAFTHVDELPYMVQRTWSNAAAAAGHDPCVPAPDDVVYFQAVPVLTDTVTVTTDSGPVQTKGVQLPAGATKTIDLDLFSDAGTGGPWDVRALDFSDLQGGAPKLSLTLDRDTGSNGDKLHLTLRWLDPDPSGPAIFVVDASQGEESWHATLGVAAP